MLSILIFANFAQAIEPILDSEDEMLNVLSAQEMERQIQNRSKIERVQNVQVPELGHASPTGDSLADLIARLGYMEEEIRNLNGQVAELKHQLKTVNTQIAETKALAVESEKYITRTGDVNDKYVIKVDGAEGEIASLEASEQDPAALEEADFNAGVAQISEQNLPAAKKKFTEFLGTYPKSDKRADTYFWLGEITMDEGEFKESALNYLKSYKEDKQGRRAEEALLKSSIALGKLGKQEEACRNLTTLKNMDGLQDLIKEQATSEASKLG